MDIMAMPSPIPSAGMAMAMEPSGIATPPPIVPIIDMLVSTDTC